MKLNLGCGNDIREGYTNVDIRKTHPSVVEADLSKFPWPFADGSADEVMLLDFLEHFPYAQTQRILLECYRILKSDGDLIVQVPDAEHLCRALNQDGYYLCNRCGQSMWERYPGNGERSQLDRCPKCFQSADEISEAAMRRLYGGQDYAGNFHQTCFTRKILKIKAKECGLTVIGFEEIDLQWANWNFKAKLKKGEIW